MKYIHNLLIVVLLALLSVSAGAQTSPITSTACASSVITVTNVSQALVAANGLRRLLVIQNNHATASVNISFGATAATTSMLTLTAGGALYLAHTLPTEAVNLIGSIASNTTVSVLECS